MARRKGRSLNPRERALWDRVAHTAKPLEKPRSPPLPPPEPQNQTKAPPEDLRSHVRLPDGFSIGAKAGSTTDGAVPRSDQIRMDRKKFQRMTRGKLTPEARMDLHGMTLADAHPALTGFILSSHAAGRRLVLVITGKGRGRDDGGPIPSRPGVLKRQVPIWLSAPPLSQAVLQVAEASRRHGGAGAYYVYLGRKK